MPKTNSVPATIVGLWMLAFLAAVSRTHADPVVLQQPSEHAKYSGASNVGATIHTAREAKS